VIQAPQLTLTPAKYGYTLTAMSNRSTLEVAKLVGIGKNTLLTWLRDGKIAEPKRVSQGGITVRLWSDRDVARVHKYKEANYRKGRGRKKAS
jgi:hypothetical protein